MPNSIKGLNFEDSNSLLLVTYGNDVAKFNPGTNTWLGQHQNLNPGGNYEMVMCKGYGYLFSTSIAPKSVTSDGTWSNTVNVQKAPWGAYPLLFKDRLVVGKCVVNGDNYFRRFYYSDIILQDNKVKWGLNYGNDLIQTAGSKQVTSASARFIQNNIKIGDPFIITSGVNTDTYAVDEIIDDNNIVLDRVINTSANTSQFIVGGNFFDIDSGVTGVGEHYGTLLAFEYNKVWKWTPTNGKKELFGVGGTSSHRSIVNNHQRYTFWFSPDDGIVLYNGSTAQGISGKIQEVVDGIDPSYFPYIVGWPGTGKYKDHVYFYVGDVANINENINITKCIIDYNIGRNTFKCHSYNAVIRGATTFIENNQKNVYLITDTNLVLKFNTGNTDYNTVVDDNSTLPIGFILESHIFYPRGPEVLNNIESYYEFLNKGTGVVTKKKLHGQPDIDDSEWQDVQEINGKYKEKKLNPKDPPARGISFLVSEISKDASFEFLGHTIISKGVGVAYADQL